MTIDEAIKHCEEVAEQNEKKAEYRPRMDYYDEIESRTDCLECAADHRQLADWLTDYKKLRSIVDACNILAVDAFAVEKLCKELKEAKRLLRAAVKDFRKVTKNCTKNFINCGSCPHTYTIHGCVWHYTGKALALIGEEERKQ